MAAAPPAPQGSLLLAGAAVALTVAARTSDGLFASLALVPGNSLLLGEHTAWSFVTAHFVSPSWALLALHAGTVYALGLRAEAPAGPHPAARVLRTALLSLALAGLLVWATRVALYATSGEEGYLYKPVLGCAPLAAVAGVLAAEAHGDAPLHPAVALPVSQVPLCIVLLAAVMQNAGLTSDATTTLAAAGVAWSYLRFFCAHGGPGAPVGDARDEFELLSLLPGPLRVALRPLEKMGSAVFLPVLLRLASATAGAAGVALLPTTAGGAATVYGSTATAGAGGVALAGAGGVVTSGDPAAAIYGSAANGAGAAGGLALHMQLHGRLAGAAGSAVAADPVAERRREKALKSLDRRLAEMRAKLKGAVPAAAAAVPAAVPASPGEASPA